MQFKAGDRFKVVNNHPGNTSYEGKLGTVCKVRGSKKYEVAIDGCGYHYEWSDDNDMQKVGTFPLKVGSVIQHKKNKSVWEVTSIADDFHFYGRCIKSNSSSYAVGHNGSDNDLGNYKILNGKHSSMIQQLNSMLKRLLDQDSQKLYKAGFINGDLELTDEGSKAILGILFAANKAALVTEAEEVIAEAEKEATKN